MPAGAAPACLPVTPPAPYRRGAVRGTTVNHLQVRGDGQPCSAFRALARVAVAACLLAPGQGGAEEPVAPERATHNLYGMTGLIDMPTAEMQPDAQVSVTSGYFDGFLRTTLSAQILPGVEAAFRYSILDDLAGEGDTLFDRSFDAKLRLVQEGPKWPGVVVGLQDFLGTGVYAGEYVAATKRFLDGDLKLTGGIGWGRFAGANPIGNPLCTATDRLCDRERVTGTGGQVELKSFFSGEDMGLFGGVEWRTPLDDLTLKAEYSDDDYDREERLSDFEREIPFNFGATYRPLGGVELGAYYMYGSEIGLRLTLSGNPFRPLAGSADEPAPPPLQPRPRRPSRRRWARCARCWAPAPPPRASPRAGSARSRSRRARTGCAGPRRSCPPRPTMPAPTTRRSPSTPCTGSSTR